MSLTFHWFLPPTGDGRSIMGRGHSLPPARPAERQGGQPAAPHIRGAAARERPPEGATVLRSPDPVPGVYFGGAAAAPGSAPAREPELCRPGAAPPPPSLASPPTP